MSFLLTFAVVWVLLGLLGLVLMRVYNMVVVVVSASDMTQWKDVGIQGSPDVLTMIFGAVGGPYTFICGVVALVGSMYHLSNIIASKPELQSRQ